jgi:hypothetical protein
MEFKTLQPFQQILHLEYKEARISSIQICSSCWYTISLANLCDVPLASLLIYVVHPPIRLFNIIIASSTAGLYLL